MEGLNDRNTMLQQMQQPAFLVEDGIISHVNHAASAYLIEAGLPFAPMLLSGGPEYEEFSSGELYVTLSVVGQSVGALVVRLENGHLVVLEQSAQTPQSQAMMKISGALNNHMSDVMALVSQLLPAAAAEGPEQESQAARLNRKLYQMMRTIKHMSQAADYADPRAEDQESVEICAFLEEILEKTANSVSGISLVWELPRQRFYTLVDREKLEQAVYNLLSNAIKYAEADTTVKAELSHKNNRLYFSVGNTHSDPGPQSNPFNAFAQAPVLNRPKDGVGLGMVIVRSTARLHGGAVLLEKTEDGSRYTLTLPVKHAQSNDVRSPVMQIDQSGGHDLCLVELSDVLPAELYTPENLK